MEDFAKKYALSFDSLQSFLETFPEYKNEPNHINKVRASTLLMDCNTWEQIVSELKSMNGLNSFKQSILDAYDSCVNISNQTPSLIYEKYIITKDCPNSQPVPPDKIIKELILVFNFYNTLSRKHFTIPILKMIIDQFDLLITLSKKLPSWDVEKRDVLQFMKDQSFEISKYIFLLKNDGNNEN